MEKPPARLPDGRINPGYNAWYRQTEGGKRAVAKFLERKRKWKRERKLERMALGFVKENVYPSMRLRNETRLKLWRKIDWKRKTKSIAKSMGVTVSQACNMRRRFAPWTIRRGKQARWDEVKA